ncbi:MAG: BACON domain-containing protein [Muribaculaceae bacterium]|nr:BACON domain-containing protein [Muribaculaceae bacterium]
MKNIFKYLMLAVVAVCGLSLTSCNDDDTDLSRKVLASVSVLEYDGEAPGVELITITSDGDWYVEAPEWITVTPSKGSVGQTEVEISVAPNYRDGLLDNPRKVSVLFKGRNLESIASILVRQGGDKFRDPVDYTIDDMEVAEDETVVSLPNMIVTALTGTGFVVTDGDQYVYITNLADGVEVAVGDKVNIVGEKFTNTMKMAYVNGDRVSKVGTAAVPDKTPVDINETLDATNGTKYQYVTVTGDYDGAGVKVGDNICKVYFIDALESMNLNDLVGHKLEIIGYYAGMASPVVNIIPAQIIDHGLNQTIYLYDDFEYLEPWCAKGNEGGEGPAADIVGVDGSYTVQPQISSAKCLVDGKTAEQELLSRGYSFLRYHADGSADGDCIYIQRNYLKFGKGKYQGGIILPKIPELGDGVEAVTLSMDMCTQRQGSGTWDPTEVVVILANGDDETVIPVPYKKPADGAKYEWQHIVMELPGKITKNTTITIRHADSQLKSTKTYRWHMDNLMLSANPK